MKGNRKLVVLSLLVILLAVFTVFWKPGNKVKEAVTTVPVASDVHVIVLQKDGGLNVYLNGKDASSVSVFETTLDYDREDVEVKSASPGGFFVQPLVLTSDVKSGKFSFSFNPGLNISRSDGILTNLPVLKIKFNAKNNLNQTAIGLNPDATRVYLFEKGVFTPPLTDLQN